jgi:hypothetical protein
MNYAYECSVPVPTPDPPERVIGGSYALVDQIGSGASGTVWRALDQTTGEEVAIKLLREELVPQPKAVMRFVQERAILGALQHENIVPVRDLLTVGDSMGLVMDLVPGGSVRRLLRTRGTLTPAEAATVMAGVAAGLSHAHRMGVVHRDLKPDNILVGDEEVMDVRLTDFGIARVLDAPALTTTGALIGTPNYLAPEIIEGGRPTPAADVYAFGMVLYELLVGRPPYAGHTPRTVLKRHTDHQPVRHPGIPDDMWRAIAACVDKTPTKRPSAGDLVGTMRALVAVTAAAPAIPAALSTPATADPLTGEVPLIPAQRCRRVPGWQALTTLATVVLLVAVVAALSLWRDEDEPAPAPVAQRSPAATPSAKPEATTIASRAASKRSATPSATGRRNLAANALSDEDRMPTEAKPKTYGALRCTDYEWKLVHPAVAKTCYATGPGVRLVGYLASAEGIRADVTVALQEAESGKVVAGPFRCDDVVFTKTVKEYACGVFETRPPAGRRYQVVQTWRYEGRASSLLGTAKGPAFAY